MSATHIAEHGSTTTEGDTRERWFAHGPRFPDPLVMVDETSLGSEPAGTAEFLWHLKDMLGSVTALANSNGTVVERYVYDPYGRTSIVVVGFEREGMMLSGGSLSGFTLKPPPAVEVSRYLGRFGNPFAWTGQRYDKGVGLYHFLFRSYSPELGRWLQRDPLGYVDGASLYGYVGSRPLGFVDPYGLIFETLWDVALTAYDVGVVVKNGVETAYGAGAVVYHDIRGNENGMAHAYDGMCSDAGELGWGAVDIVADGASAIVPVLPAGATKAARLAGKAADAATDVAKVGDNVADVARAGDNVADAGRVAGQVHHVATDKSIKSGYTDKLKEIFDKAGMKLDDAANKIFLEGHKGRHAKKYHEYVLRRLQNATDGLEGAEYEKALRRILETLKKELKANPDLVKTGPC